MPSPIPAIIKREYLTRVRTKGFWISTILVPLIMIAVMLVPALMARRQKARPEPIVVVDLVGDYFESLDLAVKNVSGGRGSAVIEEPARGRTVAQLRKDLNERAEKGDIQGYLIVEPASLEKAEVTFYARNPSGALEDDWFRGRMRESFTRYQLNKLGLKDAEIATATRRLDIGVLKATNDPKRQESGISALLVSLIFMVFMYSALIMYGMYVMRGVLEEKSNRIVEVIVSSVKPFELMAGKLLGIGAVGLTQMLVWALFGLISTAPQLAVALSLSRDVLPTISLITLAAFPVFFILGFFLYATIYAGIGSMCNSDEDAQQMAFLPVMLIVVSFVMFSPVMRDPNSRLAVVLSLIPFFAPLLMFLRIALETPPAWQIAASVAIMAGTTVLMTWLVAKIYRVGILMYGKKPTIPEVLRWLKYA